MPKCSAAGCPDIFTDGAHCSSCNSDMHFHCAGITEHGYRRLGDRRSTWRCQQCKQNAAGKCLPPSEYDSPATSPVPAHESNQEILIEIKALAEKLAPLDSLMKDFKSLAGNFKELKTSVSEANKNIKEMTGRFKDIEDRLKSLESSKKDITDLQIRVEKMESELSSRDQWSRMNNVEVKGIPEAKNENLLEVILSIGNQIDYQVNKQQINYVARIPTRDPDRVKPIIVCFNNRYVKEDFVAAARTASGQSPLTCPRLGLPGTSRVYVNDHLTPQNKILLSKAKVAAKERDFQYVWVKHCKIMARKNSTSPKFFIKTEKDLANII